MPIGEISVGTADFKSKSSRLALMAFARISKGARSVRAAPSTIASSSKFVSKAGQSQSGTSALTHSGAVSRSICPLSFAIWSSVSGSPKCRSSLVCSRISSTETPPEKTVAPSARERGLSSFIRKAIEDLRRSASRTIFPIAERSLDPAKR